MPNYPRQLGVGEVHHVFNRGYEGRIVFRDNADRKRFLESLCYFNNKTETKIQNIRNLNPASLADWIKNRDRIVDILAFVLMPNHYHLILKEIVEEGISLFMQKLSNGYTSYFNKRYERKKSGGIFQSRYRSVKISSDKQMDVVFNYVHTNPIELLEEGWKEFKVIDSKRSLEWLRGYKWSSFPDYIGLDDSSAIIEKDFFLKFYGNFEGCNKSILNWTSYKARKTKLGPEIIEV